MAVTERELIGSGRSGQVFLDEDIAIKVFSSGGFWEKAANYVFTGAPNHYSWNTDAVICADYRRDILVDLVKFWFGDSLRVAESYGVKWNDQLKGYELHTEFIEGRHAHLHSPFSRSDELSDLVNNIMKPLQQRLMESGFDGLVWQAGLGNPVAANNFMLELDREDQESQDVDRSSRSWVWIDLESGVPGLFPLNTLTLFNFYGPKSWHHGSFLFDDVDISKLRSYVDSNEFDLVQTVGSDRYTLLQDNINQLQIHQERWKSLKRYEKGIEYQLMQGNISQDTASWYKKHPFLWYAREIVRGTYKLYEKVICDIPNSLLQKSMDVLSHWKDILKFIFSEKYSSKVVRDYFLGRVNKWRSRGQLKDQRVEILVDSLSHEHTTPYLKDLFMHGIIKPVEYFGLPLAIGALYANGNIGLLGAGLLAFWGGSIARTAYTLGRIGVDFIKPSNLMQLPEKVNDTYVELYNACCSNGTVGFVSFPLYKMVNSKRGIALALGVIPTIGNVAYPAQMTYSGSTKDKVFGKFLLYDIFTEIGKKVPIWGGRDTRTEHFFNHMPNLILRNLIGLE